MSLDNQVSGNVSLDCHSYHLKILAEKTVRDFVSLTIARCVTCYPLTTSRTLLCEHRGRPAAAIRGQAVKEMDLQSFGQSNFGELDLGDKRRTRRLVDLVDIMCRHPGGTLPAKLSKPADLRAFYLLMDCETVTHTSVMDGHTSATRRKMETALREGNTLLILHDATELDYTLLTSLRGKLGQIGQGTHYGYICHNSLVVQAEPQLVLGLSSQILHHRAKVPKKETDAQRRNRENRESRLWVQGASQSGPAPVAGGLCVDVSDSLSDTFEYMAFEVANGRSFVLRSRENRKLADPIKGIEYLQGAVRQQPSVASRIVQVQQTAKHVARSAVCHVSFTPVCIAPPRVRLGDYENVPLNLWAVRVWEAHPTPGVEALEWILLTNVPVITEADASERVTWYEARWVVEDLHKGMKTGCGIETLQFTRIERLEPAIAVLSALATTLLQMRDAARQPDADVRPATDVVSQEYVTVLSEYYGTRLGKTPTILQFYMHVARLGGHQNRKRDGFPGWITLWRGWMKLQSMVDGHRLGRMRQNKCGRT